MTRLQWGKVRRTQDERTTLSGMNWELRDENKQLRSRLYEWRRIDTAPKDGTPFLGWSVILDFPFVMLWNKHTERWRVFGLDDMSPKHFPSYWTKIIVPDMEQLEAAE